MKARSKGALAAAVYAAGVLSACDNVISPSHQIPQLAPGWQGQLIANGFKKPRSLFFDNEGNLIVLDAGVGVRRLTLKDDGDTCLSVSENKLVVENEDLNHGLAFSGDGKTLYASTVESVFAWEYNAGAGTVNDDPRVVINGMSNNDHTTRTLLMSKKADGMLVVSRGSDENFDIDALDADSGVSQIKVFDLNRLGGSETYAFNTDGRRLGWGLRNSVGIAEDPDSGNVYSVETSIDEIQRGDVDIAENNPGEELNMHGKVTDNGDGDNYGYPYCYPLWDTNIPDNDGLSVGDVFSVNESAITDEQCDEDYTPPRLVFPAHTSPLNLLFSDDGSTLYISFRGSFDPSNPVGYMVSSVKFADGQPEAWVTDNDALSDVMTNPDHSQCPDGCFRPVGLAWDSEGRLWVSSDNTGEIYVLKKLEKGDSPGSFITESGAAGVARGMWGAPAVAASVGAVILAGLLAL